MCIKAQLHVQNWIIKPIHGIKICLCLLTRDQKKETQERRLCVSFYVKSTHNAAQITLVLPSDCTHDESAERLLVWIVGFCFNE
jgi:hypothetical protein